MSDSLGSTESEWWMHHYLMLTCWLPSFRSLRPRVRSKVLQPPPRETSDVLAFIGVSLKGKLGVNVRNMKLIKKALQRFASLNFCTIHRSVRFFRDWGNLPLVSAWKSRNIMLNTVKCCLIFSFTYILEEISVILLALNCWYAGFLWWRKSNGHFISYTRFVDAAANAR